MSLKSLCNPSAAEPAKAATRRRPSQAHAPLRRFSKNIWAAPERIGVLRVLGLHVGVPVAWRRTAPTKGSLPRAGMDARLRSPAEQPKHGVKSGRNRVG